MKRILSKITLLILLSPLLCLAGSPGWTGKYTKEKKINKEFTVSPDALLKIDNSYGNLYITSWNENRTVIEVHIKTNSNSEDKAQKKLDQITVEFDANSGMVSAKTIFEKSSWGWNWGNNNNVSMEINYTVKVPVGNHVDLSNDYGSINLDRLDGNAEISCDYGRIDIGYLNGNSNRLSFDYTSKSEIEYVKNARISADYSGYTIAKAGNLEISADYTNSTIEEAANVEYSCDYGSFKIDKAGNVKGSGDYVTIRLGEIHGNVELSSDYGSIRIDELAADAGNVAISSDYTGIKIGYNSGYHFDFEIKMEYAGLGGGENFQYNIKRERSTEKYYTGYHGSTGKNKLAISTDYGSVQFNQK
ncbi:hypothetical protein [Robertkochia solimangrovi]|uniref:hypothetical protein n=1 Tax=Robertkochia solimangrovi TaxID=2213046 RepID=UPI00117E87F8|nr:hypothetical protein [Robertkochia solimangrovi]TRZ43484.1 hypothetical protein DMZ48_08630 [Robertkochia solimangrovi]